MARRLQRLARPHVGYVHHVAHGRIYSIEANKTSNVDSFSCLFASMDRLFGFVRL